ncbi:GPI ethanolamine phosphate transferase 1-like [Cimex lectularius]|uniref:GPI ethanolamine phosphate transferase 1 n=1 Tax=Cimex lectularius TaxID=79782 RepID=A0A8I6S3P1_CIMLE|nr:GPI ethanolamine phosphate transferase 1-like [Cimex lectularius]
MYKLYGVVFTLHLVFLIAVFDIYFKSPLLEGLQSVENNVGTDVERLVLFVGDGLRADTFFSYENNRTNVPFLREKIVKGKAAWGISYLRVPTESRPGHVALIAGIYEDPSAVFRGWKENPYPFDSVFNRSRLSFSWGSPDIVTLFKDESQDHIFYEAYTPQQQDFSGKNNASHSLNIWVYEKVQLFFLRASRNETLGQLIRQNKIIFFLHFLGIDVAGHSAKPHSQEYISNVRGTDDIVKKVEKIIEDFYNDNKTAYVFTSDHGMTSWGSHGDGSPTETETPFVAWGAGVQPSTCNLHKPKDVFFSSGLPRHCRHDIKQADAAVLMSILLGVSIPTNSMGKLPVDYLKMSNSKKFDAYTLNALQLLEQLNKRHDILKNSVAPWLFKEYSLTRHNQEQMLSLAGFKSKANKTKLAMLDLEKIIQLALEGIKFYETYFQNYLLFLVTMSYLGLMACIVTELLQDNGGNYCFNNALVVNRFFMGVLLVILFLFAVNTLPMYYLPYNLIPLFLWWYAILQASTINMSLSKMLKSSNLYNLLLYIGGTEIMLLSFYNRGFLTFGMVALSLWPLSNKDFRTIPRVYSSAWTMTCWVLAIFPLLPTVKTSEIHIEFIAITGLLWFLFGLTILSGKIIKVYQLARLVVGIQVIFIIPTVCNIYSVFSSIESGHGLQSFNQLLSICLVYVYIGTLIAGPVTVLGKFIGTCFSLGITFLLFCTSHEALFPLVLSLNLMVWMVLEYYLNMKNCTSNNYKETVLNIAVLIRSHDFRKAFFFIFYIVFSFFAIGNIDSLNSFDVNWVRCFLTVFAPFTMMVLILVKTIIPLLLVSCAFRFVVVITRANTRSIFLVSLLFCEIMCLHFLFMVTNEGSWLEIGKSLSHYVIMEVMVLILIILYQVACYFTVQDKVCKKLNKNIRLHVLPKWHDD